MASEPGSTSPAWSRQRWSWLLGLLTLITFAVHGYHPFTEDGGLYVAGIEFLRDRSLFPHFPEFVTEHLRFSLFAPLLSTVIGITHLSLATTLLLVYLASIAFTLLAALAVLRRVTVNERARLAGVSMLAALWTLPVAATSLLLMDPYVTARSLSTPLSLFAVALAIDDWGPRRVRALWRVRSFVYCVACLVLAALLHPLMAGYAVGLVLMLRLLRKPAKIPGLVLVVLLTLALAAVLQARAPAESPAIVAASLTRYYWFLSQWHWYELIGLAGPLLVFVAFLRRWKDLPTPGVVLCHAAIALGLLSVLVALLFAHESYRSHLVARLQPLRSFLLIYAVMVLLLGAALQQLFQWLASCLRHATMRRCVALLPMVIFFVTAFGMFATQQQQFPASAHVELPWRAQKNPNLWVQAFSWCRAHTPPDALFALDSDYIHLPAEDSQIFRAIAERSALPDFSKDGGEAAITPTLAREWAEGVGAQKDLSKESDAMRLARLQPYPVDWLILLSSAHTTLPCPYRNGAVKVCRLRP